jgi:hypothetical protein
MASLERRRRMEVNKAVLGVVEVIMSFWQDGIGFGEVS